MLIKIRKIATNNFIRNIILVASGAAGAQAITLALSPIITRLYGPEAFGVLGAFMAVLAVFTPVAALAYPVAIVLPKTDDDARVIAKLSALIALTISLLIMIVFFFVGEQIAGLLKLESISEYLILIPIATFFAALQQIMQQWLIRKNKFKVTARVAISQSFFFNITKVLLGFYYPFGIVLVIIITLGDVLYTSQLWLAERKWVHKSDRVNNKPNVRVSMKYIAFKYLDFPLYRAPQVFINAVSQGLPVLLLASFFGPASAGFFTLSRAAIAAPATLLGSSVGNVFYPKASEMVNNGESPKSLLVKSTIGIFLFALIPFSVIIFFGPEVFKFIFGMQWETAGEYARWIAIWMLVSLAARPTIALIPILKMQGFFLTLEVFFLGIKLLGLLIGSYFYKSDLFVVSIYSIISAVFYILLFLLVFRKFNSGFYKNAS